jgi:hypothetical protein
LEGIEFITIFVKKILMVKKEIIWLVSEISAILGESISNTQENVYVWSKDSGDIILDTKKKEIKIVDRLDLDVKTYYAIIGFASIKGMIITK